MHSIQIPCLLLGRLLLGLYFIIPGLQKIFQFSDMSAYMQAHEVPFIPVLLPLTIILQLSAGLALIVGYKAKLAAFILAGLTLVISMYMHDFWNLDEGITYLHELQNFMKNLGIMAGLLMIAALGTGEFSIDNLPIEPEPYI